MGTLYGYKKRYWKPIYDFSYKGEPEKFTLNPGTYLLICHGANGGLTPLAPMNHGGSAYGVLTLNETTDMFAVVGGDGTAPDPNDYTKPGIGGFNGGADGGLSYNYQYRSGAGGGGASDIRLFPDDGTLIPIDVTQTLPSGYKELMYVQSSGYQCVDTKYIHTSNTKIECDCEILSNSYQSYEAIFGSRKDRYTDKAFVVFSRFADKDIPVYNRSGVEDQGVGMLYDQRIKIIAHKDMMTWYKDDTEIGKVTATGSIDDGVNSMFIFDINVSPTDGGSKIDNSGSHIRLYSFKIYEDDELKCHFVPCYEETTNTVGLYDIINNNFHTSMTSSPLIGGYPPNKSLFSRLIVAGGGGGGTNMNVGSSSTAGYFGFGGGVYGGPVTAYTSNGDGLKYATQTNGFSFGTGMTPAQKIQAQSYGAEGASGGGGGWFGGFASEQTNASNSSANGGGGSGYVFTESSYKPEGYILDERFYLTDTFMNIGSAEKAQILVCVPTTVPFPNDTVIFPCIGEIDEFDLFPGTYKLKCFGADGGVRYDSNMCGKGGYVEGIFNNPIFQKIYVSVGGTGLWGTLGTAFVSAAHPTISFNGGGNASSYSSLANGGTAGGGGTDFRIGSDSLYSRIIVAGGGGGQGKLNSYPGAGGGETGSKWSESSGYGTSDGPGTQTGSPITKEAVQGGFGYGGNASNVNDGYGGAGGGGWFGGAGCYPDSSGDDDHAGSGGSGYVFTESSYKPSEYLLDESYYMTDTVLITGGNNLPYGQSKAEMYVISTNIAKIIVQDSIGFKRYDPETNKWVVFKPTTSELTIEDFDMYGTYSMTTDEGLLDSYTLYVYDVYNTLNTSIFDVVPPTQNITTIADTSMRVNQLTIDAEYDSSIIEILPNVKRIGVADDAKLELTLSVNKKDETDIPTRIYCISIRSTGNLDSTKYIPPKSDEDESDEELTENKALLQVGVGNNIPAKYNQYLGLLDGNTVTSINSVLSCVHNRVLYIAILLNDTTLRLQKINLLTNKSTIIVDIPKSSIGNYYYGGMLVDDNYIYITPSYNNASGAGGRRLYRIHLEDNAQTIDSFVSGPNDDYRFTSYGKMLWYNDHTIILDDYRGFVLFDTITTQFERKYYSNKSTNRSDMSVGKKIALSHYYANGSGATVYTCNIEENIWSSITLPSANRSCSCYDGDGRFYIAISNYLVIWNEDLEVIEKTIAVQWTNPKTIHYTDGIIYVTTTKSSRLWVYDIKNDLVNQVVLPWTIPDLVSESITNPSVFKGYLLIPYWTLAMVNFVDPVKYNIGYKYNQYNFIFSNENSFEYTYNDKYVTFNDTHVIIHDGEIQVPLEVVSEDGTIKKCSMNKNQYNKLKNVKFKQIERDETVTT